MGARLEPLQKETPHMDSVKYIGMDAHEEAISIAVLNSSGKVMMECVIETKASSILQFFQGLGNQVVISCRDQPEHMEQTLPAVSHWAAIRTRTLRTRGSCGCRMRAMGKISSPTEDGLWTQPTKVDSATTIRIACW